MTERRYFWVFDRTIFDQIRMPEFTWVSVGLMVLALCGFAAYLLLIRYIDHRVLMRQRRQRQEAHLERILAKAALSAQERQTLADLAGGEDFDDIYGLLTRVERFESAVHAAVRAGLAERLGFTDPLRSSLGFHSDNLRAAIVSTRQLQAGNAIRITVWAGGLPQHFYGTVGEVGLHTFTVLLREDAAQVVQRVTGDCELYHVRALDVEYRFPCRFARGAAPGAALQVQHALVAESHGARGSRLPLLREIEYRLVHPHGDAVSHLDPEFAPSSPQPALLFDLSEGGFAVVTERAPAEGRLVHIDLPLKRGRGKLALTGRILESREFSGNQWLTRCELRGLTPAQRSYLQQILRVEHQRRQQTLAPVRRAARADGPAPEHPAQPPDEAQGGNGSPEAHSSS